MKIRTDFVTNSSSSSFVIAKGHLCEMQIYKIKNHRDIAEKLNFSHWQDPWIIDEDEFTISGWTSLDNFDMREFFELIGIPINKVKWSN